MLLDLLILEYVRASGTILDTPGATAVTEDRFFALCSSKVNIRRERVRERAHNALYLQRTVSEPTGRT
jgi:hypothetical protein